MNQPSDTAFFAPLQADEDRQDAEHEIEQRVRDSITLEQIGEWSDPSQLPVAVQVELLRAHARHDYLQIGLLLSAAVEVQIKILIAQAITAARIARQRGEV